MRENGEVLRDIIIFNQAYIRGFWSAGHAETSEGFRNTGSTRNPRRRRRKQQPNCIICNPFHITSQHHLTSTWNLCPKIFFVFDNKQTKNVKSNALRAPKKLDVFLDYLLWSRRFENQGGKTLEFRCCPTRIMEGYSSIVSLRKPRSLFPQSDIIKKMYIYIYSKYLNVKCCVCFFGNLEGCWRLPLTTLWKLQGPTVHLSHVSVSPRSKTYSLPARAMALTRVRSIITLFKLLKHGTILHIKTTKNRKGTRFRAV